MKPPDVLDVEKYYVVLGIFDLHISIEKLIESKGYLLSDYLYVMDNTQIVYNDGALKLFFVYGWRAWRQ